VDLGYFYPQKMGCRCQRRQRKSFGRSCVSCRSSSSGWCICLFCS